MSIRNFSKNDSYNYGINNTINKEKYLKKYQYIKKLVKSMIFENAALCDEISHLQEKTMVLIEERNFLFKKLHQFQSIQIEPDPPVRQIASLGEGAFVKKANFKKKLFETSVLDQNKIKSGASVPKKQSFVKKKKIMGSVPLDSFGKPIFPILLGDFTVHSIGEVCDKADYHTEDLIYPVGFCSTRIYGSLKNPEKQCVYTCKVMDGGISPRFEIVADSDLDAPIASNCIDRCHSTLLQRVNAALGTEVVNTKGRGADFFGLSHPAVHQLIQASPGVRKCSKYVWTKFQPSSGGSDSFPPETEASLSFTALLRSIAFSKSNLEHMVKTPYFSA